MKKKYLKKYAKSVSLSTLGSIIDFFFGGGGIKNLMKIL